MPHQHRLLGPQDGTSRFLRTFRHCPPRKREPAGKCHAPTGCCDRLRGQSSFRHCARSRSWQGSATVAALVGGQLSFAPVATAADRPIRRKVETTAVCSVCHTVLVNLYSPAVPDPRLAPAVWASTKPIDGLDNRIDFLPLSAESMQSIGLVGRSHCVAWGRTCHCSSEPIPLLDKSEIWITDEGPPHPSLPAVEMPVVAAPKVKALLRTRSCVLVPQR